jgi:hypothetical protein
VVGIAHERDGFLLPDTWTDAGAVENDVASRPVLAEKARLPFSERGQLIVLLPKERGLCMTDEKEDPHCQPSLVQRYTARPIAHDEIRVEE